MCNITTGIEKNCDFIVAGNGEEVYLINAASYGATIGTGSQITGLTGSYYRFQVAEDSLMTNVELQKGGAKNRLHLHMVQFKINSNSNEIKNIVEDLELSRVVAVVRDRNGYYKVYGTSGAKAILGLQVETAPFTSGLAGTDEFGYTITLQEFVAGRELFLDAGLDPSGSGVGPYTWS